MSWFTNLFSGGVSSIVDSVADVADRFIETDEEKKAFKLKAQELVQKRMSEIETTARAELDAKQNIIVAELQQGDNYTKRARPTVVYFGLVVILYNYCLIPTIGVLINVFSESPFDMPVFELPVEFWVAWGGIVSTWTIGRSAEKRGNMNRLTGLITGSDKKPSMLE